MATETVTSFFTDSRANTTSNNNSNNAFARQSGRHNSALEIPIWLIMCYSVILLCAIVGNLLVISVLVQNRRMRTITNVFLLNLAISDILLGVLCMPVTLVGTLLRHFIFGEFFCKLIQFSQAASVAISSWTLVAISCERYYAICHPLLSRRWQTRSHAYKIIVCIWCGSMLCMSPIAVFSQLMPTSRQGLLKCRENWPDYAQPYERSYNLFLDLILLVLPLIILSVAYILITRTLYVGMRIEKAMIFGGKQDGKALSHQRSNSSVRCNGGTTKITSYNNISRVATANNQGDIESGIKETSKSSQQLQQQKPHHFQNQKQKHEGAQHQQQQLCPSSHLEQQQSQQQYCCETLLRSWYKRSNTTLTTNSNTRRPHLYCMRFANLKTTLTDKKGNGMSNFCSTNCCNSSGSTIKLNINNINTNLEPATMAPASTSIATMYRYQLHEQYYKHQPKHIHTRNCCRVQKAGPQIYSKTITKKYFNKRNLKATESVLRRNNIAKNLECKKRVVKMLFVVVLEFFICWTPLYIINTVAMYIGSAIYEYIDYTSISALQLLAYSSSCCNPITYCFMNANFRRAFWDTFKVIRWHGKRFERKHSTAQNGNHLCLAGSIRVNSCTLQTVIDSPRL